MIKVRQTTINDLNEIAELFNKYRQFQGEKNDLNASRKFIQERIEQNESTLFIAETDIKAVGFAQLYPMFSSVSLSRVFILNDLFVCESSRRKGVAKELLNKVEAFAFSNNASRVTLNVARDNEKGQALYKAANWEQDEQFYQFHRFA